MTALTVTIDLSNEDRARLDRLARETSLGVDSLTAEAVRHYLDLQDWQAAGIRDALRDVDQNGPASDEEVEATFARLTNKISG